MTGPARPWTTGSRNFLAPQPPNNLMSPSVNGVGPDISSGLPRVRTYKNPPPLPPRQNRRIAIPPTFSRSSAYPVMGNYSYPGYNQFNQYGGMGYASNYSSYAGYNRLGGYGYGNSYGGYPLNSGDNRFIQLAEERARPAFQSIESVLQTFSAISLMLDSTFMAMHTSFRAVLGVAENFAKLRSFLKQFLSAIATLKIVRWFYRHILYLLGIVSKSASKEELWQEALVSTTTSSIPLASPQNRMSLPVVMFMGLMLAGPYLIFKLLNSLYPTEEETAQTWNPAVDPYQLARATFDFQAQAEGELSFQQGQTLRMEPLTEVTQSTGWVLVADQYNKIGYAPLNRLTLGPVVQQQNQQLPSRPPSKAPDLIGTNEAPIPADQEF